MLKAVDVPRQSIASLEPVVGEERFAELTRAAGEFRQRLAGRAIWNVSSTALGGGVAEMLEVLVGYVRDLGVAIHWSVITGDAEFFAVTKRVHNHLHGDGTGGPFTQADDDHYREVLAANAAELAGLVRPGDLVLLHDPQTAGLTESVLGLGASAVWRCHIGVDWQNDATRSGWDFLWPYLADAQRYVFTRREYAPSWMPNKKVAVIPPSIDPASPKNQDLGTDTVPAILTTIGVLRGTAPDTPPAFTRRDGTMGVVTRPATIVGEGRPGPGDQVVVQVSRWDRLKDMAGVMRGFADYVAPSRQAFLLLVGPAVAEVTDDPEGAAVYQECLAQWQQLPSAVRASTLLVTLPLDDVDENAAMVNALQRHAAVVTQKSLAEGFGLTVAEAMWKARPVVGSAVGGIIDQIAPGTGILLSDPHDLAEFGAALCRLLDDPAEANRMGQAAQAHVRACYVGDLHLLRYANLFSSLIS
ncbi:MAG TPA: glycosyltransferase [Streptosporangiaceae bacterium]|nr:glycosyltransferase [Streptosporangiaceae bacterium]